MIRVYLAIHTLLAYAPSDELCVLRAEIENENEFVLQAVVTLLYIKERLYALDAPSVESQNRK
jgi:hypothetical protein